MGLNISKRILVLASALAATQTVLPIYDADARPSTRSYTCQGAQNFVRQRGAVVMNHKNNSLYQRFVANLGYCKYPANRLKRFRVPTKDGTCSLYVCDEYRPFDRR